MSKEKNYENYRFRPNETLEVSPRFFDKIFGLCNEVLAKESRFESMVPLDLVHKETGKKAPKNLSEKKRAEYTEIPNIERLLSSKSKQYISDLGKQALEVQLLLGEFKMKNIDLGKGIDVSEQVTEQPLTPETPVEDTDVKMEVVNDEQAS